LAILQDSNFIPGGFDYVRFTFVHYSTTPRTNGKASVNSTDDPGEFFFFTFLSVTLSARGLPFSVVSLPG
jgi:hypothetical protein